MEAANAGHYGEEKSMRFAHMADLHIGKKLGPFERLDDQRYTLMETLGIIAESRVDAVFLAGDIYDRSVPSAEAVVLADEFLTRLSEIAPVFIVAGNHDSPERLAFGRGLMREKGVFIAGAYDGHVECHTLFDAFGPVRIHLLPFIRPRETEIFFENADFDTADQAVRAVIDRDGPVPGERNILITHQFVTARSEKPVLSDSEVIPAGGLSEVDSRVFDGYQYVALGHLHAVQRVGRDAVRYAGSPLKYSFSEARHVKSVTVGEMDGEGNVKTTLLPLPYLRDLRVLRGPLSSLTDPALTAGENPEDYVSVTLTDEVPPAAPMEALSAVYPNVAHLELPSRQAEAAAGSSGADTRTPMELFRDFYRLVSGNELTPEMETIAQDAMQRAREGAE